MTGKIRLKEDTDLHQTQVLQGLEKGKQNAESVTVIHDAIEEVFFVKFGIKCQMLDISCLLCYNPHCNKSVIIVTKMNKNETRCNTIYIRW